MEVRRLLLLAALLPAAAATFGPQQPGAPCEPTLLATQVSLFCAPDMPTAQCCEPVVAAVDLGGGVPCLCHVAAEPQLVMAGLNATHLLALYTSCGGLRLGGAHLAAACEGPAPPVAVAIAPPPSPAPRRKQPPNGAPPPPPSTEKKPSPPPQQHEHDGVARSKADPAYPVASLFTAAAAIPPSAPQTPHSGSNSQRVSCEGAASAAAGQHLSPVTRLKQQSPYTSRVCARAVSLSAAVALECGYSMADKSCCSILKRTLNGGNVLLCLCALSASEAVNQVSITSLDLVNAYATCTNLPPGDLHLPSGGCAQVLDLANTPPPLTPGVSPTSTVASSPAQPKSDHEIAVAVLFFVIFLSIVVAVTSVILVWKRGNGSMRMLLPCFHDSQRTDLARLELQQLEMARLDELLRRTNAQAEGRQSSTTTDPNSAESDDIVEVPNRVRFSPRLAGEKPGPALD